MPLTVEDGGNLTVGFIGAGMMGGAMIRGLVHSGTCSSSDVYFFDVSDVRIREMQSEAAGVVSCVDNVSVCQRARMVVIAVEPKDTPHVCAELSKVQDSGSKIFVSLAAGVTMASLASWLPAGSKIARVMPNTPCVVGEMAAGYVCNHECTTKDASLVGSMLGALGSALKLADEEDIDAVTGVAGSAPAYVFQFIEALSDGGVRMGLARHVATTLAAKTVRGAATMVLESGKHPGALKDEVTSPGGTTIAAIHALECGGMRAAVMNAVVAATEKSRELGGKKRARDGQDGDAAA
jgi:pyrroline-5-carboxylate reductase